MASIKIVLRQGNPTKGYIVFLRFQGESQTNYTSLGIKLKINKHKFGTNEGTYVPRTFPNSAHINNYLLKKTIAAEEAIWELKRNEKTVNFKNFIAIFKPKKDILFKDLAKAHHATIDNENSAKVYKYALDFFDAFAPKITLNKITAALILKFKQYLIDNNANSTARTYFIFFKKTYRYGVRKGFPNQNALIDIDDVKKKPSEHSKEFLTFEEVSRLCDLFLAFEQTGEVGHYQTTANLLKPLTPNDYAKLKAYLFSIYAGGLRLNDCLSITYGQIKEAKAPGAFGSYFIQFTAQKTKQYYKNAINPILPKGLELLGDFQNKPAKERVFKQFSSTNDFNNGLKRCVNAAGILKHITSHTARHTFVSLCILAGIDRAIIRDITGHSSEEMTAIYNQIKNYQHADTLANAWNMAKQVKYNEEILDLGRTIRWNMAVIRKTANDTMPDAARKISQFCDTITSSQYQRYESGDSAKIDIYFLFAFCKAYKIPIDRLYKDRIALPDAKVTINAAREKELMK